MRLTQPIQPAPGALYDKTSVYWKVNSRWSVLAGGPAAVLMQVAHPSVGAGVAAYSTYKTDPFGRLERTLDSMLAISFGSPQRREDTLAAVRNVHRPVVGTRSDGVDYRALDPDLLLWVWATLGWVALQVERRYVRRLGQLEREQFYAESTRIAECFKVPPRLIPSSLGEFNEYVADTVAGLVVSAEGRDVAETVVRPKLPWTPGALTVPVEWVTADLLPGHLRRQFGIAPLTPLQRRVLRGARGMGRLVLPNLPSQLTVNPLAARAVA